MMAPCDPTQKQIGMINEMGPAPKRWDADQQAHRPTKNQTVDGTSGGDFGVVDHRFHNRIIP